MEGDQSYQHPIPVSQVPGIHSQQGLEPTDHGFQAVTVTQEEIKRDLKLGFTERRALPGYIPEA